MIPLPVYKNHKTTSAKNGKESSPPLILCFTVFFQTLGEQNSECIFQLKYFGYFWMHLIGSQHFGRVEICRDRHDRRSCKICANCVNFPGNQCNVSHNLHRTTRFTHTKCDFALKNIKILHTQINFNNKATKITDIYAFLLFLF